MTTTLTERYISAVTRRLPAAVQNDVRDELAASVADEIEARLEQGEAPGDAERAVLSALGDPDALAAGYADRPLQLIGPRYYLAWWRLLKLLLWIVPACVLGAVILAKLIEDAPVGEIVGAAAAATVGSIVHVAFWTTVVFAVLDRTGADATVGWDLDSLPEPQETGAGRGDLIGSLVFLGIAAAAVLWDRFIGIVFFADEGVDVGVGLGSQTTAVPLLDPQLWPWWMGGVLLVIAAEAVLAIVVYARRGWSPVLAAANTVLAVAIAAAAVYLLVTDQVLNPVFSAHMIDQLGVPAEVGRILAIITGISFVGVAVWDIIDGWLKAIRARRPLS